MPPRLGIVEAIVIVDEISRERRLVLRPDEVDFVALQSIDVEFAAGTQTLGNRGIRRIPQALPGAPQKSAA
jgi:hypothetical protein